MVKPGVNGNRQRAWRLPRRSDIRSAIDRVLHDWRRKRARSELGRIESTRSVLFICHGNVCRSPYAAKAFEKLCKDGQDDIRVDSAGFVGPGRPTPAPGVVVAARRDVKLANHISKVWTLDMLGEHDLIVVMNAEQKRALARRDPSPRAVLVLGDLDPEPIESRTIFDPWKGQEDEFERSYERIDRCLRELRTLLFRSR